MLEQMLTAASLIQQIYDAVEDLAAWDVFLESYKSAVDADLIVLTFGDEEFLDFGFVRFVGTTDEIAHDYNKNWAIHDPWVHAMRDRLEEGAIEFGHNLCSDDELVQLPIYKEFLSKNNWHYGIAAVILRTSNSMSVISAARSRDKGPYTQQEFDLLSELLPHLQQAARMHGRWARLRTQHRVISEYMDQLGHGFALLSEDGQLLFANGLLRTILAKEEDLCLRQGRLTSRFREDGAQLSDALKRVTTGGGPERLALQRSEPGLGRGILMSSITQAPAVPLGIAVPAIAVMVVDRDRRTRPDEQMLTRLFALTPTESAFALRLADGLSVEEIAAEKGISLNTARTHLKRLFTKTGSNRQSELVRILLTLSAGGEIAAKSAASGREQ